MMRASGVVGTRTCKQTRTHAHTRKHTHALGASGASRSHPGSLQGARTPADLYQMWFSGSQRPPVALGGSQDVSVTFGQLDVRKSRSRLRPFLHHKVQTRIRDFQKSLKNQWF